MASKPNAPVKPPKPSFAAKLGKMQAAEPDNDYSAIMDELTEWLEQSYKFWQADHTDWRLIQFETAEEAKDAHDAALWYCRNREAGSLTFSRKKDQDPSLLVYRVRDKVSKPRRARSDTQASDTPEGEGQPETTVTELVTILEELSS